MVSCVFLENVELLIIVRSECEKQVKGFPSSEFKKLPTAKEAEAYMKGEDIQGVAGSTSQSSEGSSRGQKRAFANVSDESECIVVYCDGACKGNGRVDSIAGVGVFWGPNDPRSVPIISTSQIPGSGSNSL